MFRVLTFVSVIARDLLISRLMHEVNELRYELERLKSEDAMLIESLNNRVRELEMELNELKQIAESTQIVSTPPTASLPVNYSFPVPLVTSIFCSVS